MPSSDTLTYDADPPHRPALSELGGGAKENVAKRPPDPVKHPTAEDFNQMSKQHEAANRVLPLARLFVRITAGTPSVFAVQALGSNVVVGDFTVTDNAAGDTTIAWTTGTGGKLPAAVGVGGLTVTSDVAIDEARAFLTTSGSNPAVRVKTKNGGTGTDTNFTVDIY
jgi:hypothetical protein